MDSTFILIGAWQVVQNGDGFEVIYWKFLTGAVEENVRPRAAVHSWKIICQNLAYLRRRLPVIFNVRLTVHKGDLIRIYVILLMQSTFIKLIFG